MRAGERGLSSVVAVWSVVAQSAAGNHYDIAARATPGAMQTLITIHVVEVRTAALNIVGISARLTRHDKSERLSRNQTLVSSTRHVKPM